MEAGHRAAAADPLGSRGAGRVRHARARLVALGFCLALIAPVARAQERNRDRVVAIAGDPRLSAEDVEHALAELIGELEGRSDRDAIAARLQGELALAARGPAGEERFAAARDALAAQVTDRDGSDRAAWFVARLANAHVAAGRLAEAEAIAGFGLDEIDPMLAWAQVPRLWLVQAEVARMQGRWVEAEERLDRMEAAVRAGDAAELSDAALRAQNHEYRARLSVARAQALLELGLLDQCGERLAAARLNAESSGVGETIASVRLLELDRLLMADRYEEAIRTAGKARDELELTPWKHLFLLCEGIARTELARQQAVADECFVAHVVRARACLQDALAAEAMIPAERLKAWLTLADLALNHERFEEADAALRAAEELAAAPGAGSGSFTREVVLIAAHRWRWASGAALSGKELEVRRAALDEAFDGLLAQWDRTPQRPGGIGFLQLGWRQLVVSEVLHADSSKGQAVRAFEHLLEAQARGTFA